MTVQDRHGQRSAVLAHNGVKQHRTLRTPLLGAGWVDRLHLGYEPGRLDVAAYPDSHRIWLFCRLRDSRFRGTFGFDIYALRQVSHLQFGVEREVTARLQMGDLTEHFHLV